MNTATLISQIEQHGVKLWVDGNTLRYSAPQGVMTPERKARISANKTALIAYLSQPANDSPSTMTSTGMPRPYPPEYCPTCIHHPGEGNPCPKQDRVIEWPESYTCKHYQSEATPMSQLGFRAGVPDADYHADQETISASGVKQILKSPAHYKAGLEESKSEPPALLFGRAAHARILEPETYEQRFVVAPAVDRRSKAGKAVWEDFKAANTGKTIISQDDAETVERMAKSLQSSPLVPYLFYGGVAEVSGYFTCPTTDVECRIRPDYARVNDRILLDLKTTLDASPSAFSRDIYKFGYHIQAAFYARGFQAITGKELADFLFVCIEKQPPFNVGIYRIDEVALEYGQRQIDIGLMRYKNCIELNHWPGYSESVESIGLPRYALATLEEM